MLALIKKTFLVVSIFVFSSLSQAAALKIGYVDLQAALQKTSAGIAAKKKLESKLAQKKKELDKKQKDLEKKRDDLQKKKDLLSQTALQQKFAEFQQEMMKFREGRMKIQREIQVQERELTAPIFKNLSKVIDELAKEKGYDMILEKSQQGIVWAKKNMDLTAELIKKFEKKHGKK